MRMRNLLIAMQIFKTENLAVRELNFGKTTRLFNKTPMYLDRMTSRMLL